MDKLFFDKDNNVFGADNIKKGLMEIGAQECETLFIHSDVMFGRPAEGFKRKEYLCTLYEVLKCLGVKNLIVPTFTYSFCNNEVYDVLNSKTSMGAFNEFVRKLDGRYRTDDPLLSISVPIEMKGKFEKLGIHSLGEGGGLDVIHRLDDVKFLFFGAEMAECFTYVHYVEKMLDVPYRFDMPFEGDIVYPDGRTTCRTQFIHTQCKGAQLPEKYLHFEAEMQDRGFLKKKRIADKFVSCISEKDAYREIKAHIEQDVNYYLEKPFIKSELVNEYTYSTKNGRITHC